MSSREAPTENPRQPPVRVVLADDQRLVRESLGTLLGLLEGIELVASAADGEEVVALAERHHPAVVLMDLRMPRMDGIEATRQLRERQPDVRVIALTTYADDESVLGALRAGARGYLTKDAGSEDIRKAILTVAAGEAALDPAVQHHVVSALASLRKGGVVAINAIHLDQMPAFDYDKLLWGERQIRSVANMTRQDAGDFLKIALELNIRPQVTIFSLDDANKALLAVKNETEYGSVVIVP